MSFWKYLQKQFWIWYNGIGEERFLFLFYFLVVKIENYIWFWTDILLDGENGTI